MDKILEKWDEILSTVKHEHDISDISFDTWIRPLEVYGVEGSTLYILVPSEQMTLSYISKKYYLPLKVTIAELTGTEYEIKFILPEQTKNIRTGNSGVPKKNALSEKADRSNLNPNYTFDTFVVGSNNRFAQSASLAVAESPGEAYNPLYIYGGPGLGKTHLMKAIEHEVKKNHPELKIIYTTGESFINQLVKAIESKETNKFHDKYRNADYLMVDDIQTIAGKERMQEEFFHTFNDLYNAGKQIVLTSDIAPSKISKLQNRILTRFSLGVQVDVTPPDFETRMAIVKKKADMLDLQLSDNVVRIIAEKIKTNIRQLEGTVNKIKALTIYTNESPSISMAQRIIKEIIIENHPAEITVDRILQEVAAAFDVTADDIKSTNRRANVSLARKIAIYLFKDVKGMTFIQIGNELNKNHSTMTIHYQDVVKNLKENKQLKDTVDDIIKNLKDN